MMAERQVAIGIRVGPRGRLDQLKVALPGWSIRPGASDCELAPAPFSC
jgi:hypothetical protein